MWNPPTQYISRYLESDRFVNKEFSLPKTIKSLPWDELPATAKDGVEILKVCLFNVLHHEHINRLVEISHRASIHDVLARSEIVVVTSCCGSTHNNLGAVPRPGRCRRGTGRRAKRERYAPDSAFESKMHTYYIHRTSNQPPLQFRYHNTLSSGSTVCSARFNV
jgi:hypothetical protein